MKSRNGDGTTREILESNGSGFPQNQTLQYSTVYGMFCPSPTKKIINILHGYCLTGLLEYSYGEIFVFY